jgi:hypothetical protein
MCCKCDMHAHPARCLQVTAVLGAQSGGTHRCETMKRRQTKTSIALNGSRTRAAKVARCLRAAGACQSGRGNRQRLRTSYPKRCRRASRHCGATRQRPAAQTAVSGMDVTTCMPARVLPMMILAINHSAACNLCHGSKSFDICRKTLPVLNLPRKCLCRFAGRVERAE